jgi:hypothetical protein
MRQYGRHSDYEPPLYLLASNNLCNASSGNNSTRQFWPTFMPWISSKQLHLYMDYEEQSAQSAQIKILGLMRYI